LAWPHERDACGVGFIADLQGKRERRVLEHALEALSNLAHRGAVSADGRTGDGAGILTQLPYRLLQRDLARAGIDGVADEDLGVGMFFAANDAQVGPLYEIIEEQLALSGLRFLMWRDLPIDDDALGAIALRRRPVFKQAIVARPAGMEPLAFERLLYLTRRRMERALDDADLGRAYISSFSSRTVVYKGLMVAD
jgi:glutamate synthase domain-containing protein 1